MSNQAPTLSMVAGTTYRFSATWASEDTAATPVDLTGCAATFVVATTQGTALLTCETGDGIELAPSEGSINVHIRPEQTAGAVSPEWSGARYELRITFPSGDVYSLLRGHFQLTPGVIHG
ncbi:DUF7264 domain-containing protein [Vreelandella titanicae]|uniref:LtfC-like domain-containing protein n=1 Tax=Vreelandella titanicae TaxID=664683 RepID=UPI0016807795|nr:hypothetical protein [Halomonas titanicae]QNU62257.1 hypothetical protein HZS52_21355 [Halomonas titanicae]